MSEELIVEVENENLIKDFIKDYRRPSTCSEATINTDRYCLRKVAHFLEEKSFNDATAKDLKQFFRENRYNSAYNLIGSKLIVFYRWLEFLEDDEKPKRMKWFKYSKEKKKDSFQLKNEIITEKEYNILLNECGRDRFGMWQGLFETFWLSGARLSEIRAMKIKDVTLTDRRCIIYVPESKTRTRQIPFSSFPYHLERWINNHPQRKNKKAPLWICNSTNNFGKRLHNGAINYKFWKIKKRTAIKDSVSIHNFRKTRFTIMSNERAPDGGLIYNDRQLSLFFGWSTNTISKMREYYDLTTFEQLKETVFNTEEETVEDIDIIKSKNKHLEKIQNKKIDELEHKLNKFLDSYQSLENMIHSQHQRESQLTRFISEIIAHPEVMNTIKEKEIDKNFRPGFDVNNLIQDYHQQKSKKDKKKNKGLIEQEEFKIISEDEYRKEKIKELTR